MFHQRHRRRLIMSTEYCVECAEGLTASIQPDEVKFVRADKSDIHQSPAFSLERYTFFNAKMSTISKQARKVAFLLMSYTFFGYDGWCHGEVIERMEKIERVRYILGTAPNITIDTDDEEEDDENEFDNNDNFTKYWYIKIRGTAAAYDKGVKPIECADGFHRIDQWDSADVDICFYEKAQRWSYSDYLFYLSLEELWAIEAKSNEIMYYVCKQQFNQHLATITDMVS